MAHAIITSCENVDFVELEFVAGSRRNSRDLRIRASYELETLKTAILDSTRHHRKSHDDQLSGKFEKISPRKQPSSDGVLVHNLSSHRLTQQQIVVLSYDAKFNTIDVRPEDFIASFESALQKCDAVILCYVRILDYLLVFKPFGPHIIIMKPMLQEFSIFLVVIIIVLVPQAIALQRLSFPYLEEFSVADFLSSLEYPYYNLYGEIEPDGLSGMRTDCAPNGINCPLANPMSNVLQVLYLFFALVLLINLLIAVFRSSRNRRLAQYALTSDYRKRKFQHKNCELIEKNAASARVFNRGSEDKTPYGQLSRVVINEKRRIDFVEAAVNTKSETQLGEDEAVIRTAIGVADRLGRQHVLSISPAHDNIVQQLPAPRLESAGARRLLGVLSSEVSKERLLCKSVRNIRDAFFSLLEEVKTMNNAMDAAVR
ncbi:unnamed protein product [Schistocephalus solidus]|uniref:Ion_trans domain-containing protein n=1 Tax=Schistocephalus solidus TaxID=70667 RepID=A0A183T248_SCHSO|nr:unnamed protein product [Schistocephalus solidus]